MQDGGGLHCQDAGRGLEHALAGSLFAWHSPCNAVRSHGVVV